MYLSWLIFSFDNVSAVRYADGVKLSEMKNSLQSPTEKTREIGRSITKKHKMLMIDTSN